MSMMVSFCAVLFPTRCLGWDLRLSCVSFWGFSFLLFLACGHFDGKGRGPNSLLVSSFTFILFVFEVCISLPSGHLVPKWRHINIDATSSRRTKMTSYQHRCDVITSHRRSYDDIFTSFARWIPLGTTGRLFSVMVEFPEYLYLLLDEPHRLINKLFSR